MFKTSYELVMFIQNSTCTIKIGLKKLVSAVPHSVVLIVSKCEVLDIGAFNQDKALVEAFSMITNYRVDLSLKLYCLLLYLGNDGVGVCEHAEHRPGRVLGPPRHHHHAQLVPGRRQHGLQHGAPRWAWAGVRSVT